ncbi:hypothetical protein AAVH_29969 [Aphelenchoides avenae]|nr:hypothetical protein AAVH_29969 [Aphelenchus avenae]
MCTAYLQRVVGIYVLAAAAFFTFQVLWSWRYLLEKDFPESVFTLPIDTDESSMFYASVALWPVTIIVLLYHGATKEAIVMPLPFFLMYQATVGNALYAFKLSIDASRNYDYDKNFLCLAVGITLLSFFITLVYGVVALKDLGYRYKPHRNTGSFLIVREPTATLGSHKRYRFLQRTPLSNELQFTPLLQSPSPTVNPLTRIGHCAALTDVDNRKPVQMNARSNQRSRSVSRRPPPSKRPVIPYYVNTDYSSLPPMLQTKSVVYDCVYRSTM